MPSGSLYTLSSELRAPTAAVADIRSPSGPVVPFSLWLFFMYATMAMAATQPMPPTTAAIPVTVLLEPPETSSARLACASWLSKLLLPEVDADEVVAGAAVVAAGAVVVGVGVSVTGRSVVLGLGVSSPTSGPLWDVDEEPA